LVSWLRKVQLSVEITSTAARPYKKIAFDLQEGAILGAVRPIEKHWIVASTNSTVSLHCFDIVAVFETMSKKYRGLLACTAQSYGYTQKMLCAPIGACTQDYERLT